MDMNGIFQSRRALLLAVTDVRHAIGTAPETEEALLLFVESVDNAYKALDEAIRIRNAQVWKFDLD